jgi:uncharacterized protein (TIRG00374 family)
MTTAAGSPRPSGRALVLLKLAISGALLAVLFWRIDRTAFLRSLQVLPLPILLGCLGLYALGYVISTIRWQRLLLAEGIHVPLWRLTLVYFEGAFFNLFFPTLIGGDIVRGYFIYKMTGGHDASVASIVVDRLSGFAALMLIATITLGFAYGTFNDPKVASAILIVAAFFVCTVIVLLNERLTQRAASVMRMVGLARFQTKLQDWVDALRRYRGHRRALAQAFLLSVILQAMVIVTYYFVGAGLNLGVPLLYFFLFVPLVTVAAMLPVSVAGLGVREGSVIYFFSKVGVDEATALGMSLVWFSLTLIVSCAGGLALLLDNHSRKRLGNGSL